MAKKVMTIIKLQIPAGQANPAPPVGPALGQHGVNIMEFCKQYNARDDERAGADRPGRDHGLRGPVVHVRHQDAARGQAAAGRGGAGEGQRRAEPRVRRHDHQGQGTRGGAEQKLPDLNTNDVDAATRILEGTARSMGLEVQGRLEGGPRAARGPKGVVQIEEKKPQVQGEAREDRAGEALLPLRGSEADPGDGRTPSSTRPSRSPSGSASTPGAPTRWSGAPSCSPRAPAKR